MIDRRGEGEKHKPRALLWSDSATDWDREDERKEKMQVREVGLVAFWSDKRVWKRILTMRVKLSWGQKRRQILLVLENCGLSLSNRDVFERGLDI